ncbi:hypothetical protein FACS1894142_2760 [Spirochaetia bacterium]|nr:hypothetical protein FACS1894142_2760 [Spirochaetia bacterium]
MSVRATERLVGDVVVAVGITSPKMLVKSVDIEAKLVTAVWFSNANEGQVGVFPASGLDRFEAPAAAAKKAPAAKAAVGKKPGKKK